MSKTLLVIFSHSGANQIVARHWPYYKVAGCDILGIGRLDAHCSWPEPVPTVDIGQEGYPPHGDLPQRIVDTLVYVLSNPNFRHYTDYCLIEADAIFLRELPRHSGDCMITTLMGGGSPGFLGSQYFHCPWWLDRGTAFKVAVFGQHMINKGFTERGFPDRFLGLLFDLYRSDLHLMYGLHYSRNSLDRPEYITEAIEAVKRYAYFIHGIKTQAQLDALAEILPPV